MRIIVLDGAESIGGTKLYVEDRDFGLLFDFGINYKKWGMYYEEYLKPRPARGLLDLFCLSLLPSVRELYREDLMPKDFCPQYTHSLRIDALFVSHAHMDHCGLVGTIKKELPIYTSAITAALMKAMQDTGGVDFYSEFAYLLPRYAKEDEVLEAGDWRKEAFLMRPFYITDDVLQDELQEFWHRAPNPKGRKLSSSPLVKASEKIKNISFLAFPVEHSIPGAQAYAINTSKGSLIYTGDFRMHGRGEEYKEEFIASLKKLAPFLLIIEGTRTERAKDSNVTEKEVYENALQIVDGSEGRLVVADFGPRHLQRLCTFLEIASLCDRTLLVFPKDMYMLEAISYAKKEWKEILHHPRLCIFDDVKVEKRGWDEGIRERYKGRLVDAKKIRKYQGEFILAFSFWDIKHLLDIQPKDGVYIYSSSEAYCEEQVLDMQRLWNWLTHFGMEVHGFYIDEGRPIFSERLHASGHASFDELINFIKEVKPRHLLPIHTQNPHLFKEALKGENIEVHILKDGAPLNFNE